MNNIYSFLKRFQRATGFLIAALLLQAQVKGQVTTYSETFTSGVTPTATQASNWVTFRSNLLSTNPYYKCKISTTAGGGASIECNNATTVQDIALKLRTGVTGSWVDGSNTWEVGTCGSSSAGTGWELAVNNSGICWCNSGWSVRPGIGNSNWGGYMTTCSAPTQTITVEFFYGPPCTAPSGLAASNVTSTSADLSWGSVSPTIGYEYVVNTTAIPGPTMTGTTITPNSANVSGLTPNTTYYLHVRNKCGTNSISAWVTYQFSTNPPCSNRSISFSNLTVNSAKVKWNKAGHASRYEYSIQSTKTIPPAGNTTTDTFYNANGLTEATKYYVYVRMLCPGGEMSDWVLDSFTTLTVCRPPAMQVQNIDADRAVVYWGDIPTSYQYEYEVSMSATPLGKGTSIEKNNFYVYPLKDDQTYYFHSKSKCVDQGFKTESEWATVTFQTFPTGISNTSKGTGISVYPNPSRDVVTVSVEGLISSDASVTICDLSGKILKTSGVTTNLTTINVSGLPAGVYTLKYSDKTGTHIFKLNKL